MGCFFDCFRPQNEGKERRRNSFSRSISPNSKVKEKLLSRNKIPPAELRNGKEDPAPFEQVTILKSSSNHGRYRENKDQSYKCKPISKNQLSAVFLREDLEKKTTPEKIEDVRLAERISSDLSRREHKQEQEKDSSDTKKADSPKCSKPTFSSSDSKPKNSFIDKHILEEESPSTTIKTPVPNKEATNLCNSSESEVVEMSLSNWLNPPKPFDIFSVKCHPSKSTDSDRPIIGSVATHWSEESETVSIPPPKVWDGKGIPNSTNKYKEDQKVSWHATPFEERLEKALSEEKLNSRRLSSTSIPLEFTYEGEESDTAAS